MLSRVQSIDAIRGFALFGIFVVNILAFSSVYYGTGLSSPYEQDVLSQFLSFIISAFFELKFYLLFSFLFGYSVTLQMQSAARACTGFLPRMMRRQIGLLMIGAIHAIFLFHGDILTTYAVFGLVLLAIRNWSNRTLLMTACGLILVTASVWLWIAFEQYNLPALDQTNEANTILNNMIATWRGTSAQIILQHIYSFVDFMPMLLLLQAPCALAFFLIGFIAGRARLFERPYVYEPWLKRAITIGLTIGLPGGLIYAWTTQFMAGTWKETAGLALSILTAPFLTLSFLAVLASLFNSKNGLSGLGQALANAGRMSLSNYLLQSFIAAMIFHGYGLGLINKLSIFQVLILAILIFILQLVLSKWWLRYFRYGPLECLLRAITILRFPDQRISNTEASKNIK